MRNFKLYSDVNIREVMVEFKNALQTKRLDFDSAFAQHPNSTTVHKESAWYNLYSGFPSFDGTQKVYYVDDSMFVRTRPIATSFPVLFAFLRSFAYQQKSILRRVAIVGLKPEGTVFPHIDEGTYYARTNRFHLVLVSPHGVRFFAGDEQVILHEGELWWFDNKKKHSVENLSDHLRIHVIFDLLPLESLSFFKKMKLYSFEFLFQSLSNSMTNEAFSRFVGQYPYLRKIIIS